MASFDENGKYIKTNWKAGDKITSTKLNKIEESIEAVNDNDISRHVEADARLDALEAKDEAHDKELTKIKNDIADNKAAAELGDYDINSRMTFLEEELNEGIEEVHNVASTVDGKIAAADANMKAQVNTAKDEMANQVNAAQANMTAQVNQGKADMEAMVAEVEGELEHIEKLFINIEIFRETSNNDTELFINAISYIENIGGGTLLLTKKEYNIEYNKINLCNNLKITSNNRAIIYSNTDNYSDIPENDNSHKVVWLFKCKDLEYVSFENIVISQMKDVTDNTNIHGYISSSCIFAENINQLFIEKCKIISNSVNALWIISSNDTLRPMNYHKSYITNNEIVFRRTHNEGYDTTPIYVASMHTLVRNNQLIFDSRGSTLRPATGMEIQCYSSEVANNYINGFDTAIINDGSTPYHFQPVETEIIGFNIYGNHINNCRNGIKFFNGGGYLNKDKPSFNGNIYSNNIILNTDVFSDFIYTELERYAQIGIGIWEHAYDDNTLRNIRIHDNNIKHVTNNFDVPKEVDSGQFGISLSGITPIKESYIYNNTIENMKNGIQIYSNNIVSSFIKIKDNTIIDAIGCIFKLHNCTEIDISNNNIFTNNYQYSFLVDLGLNVSKVNLFNTEIKTPASYTYKNYQIKYETSPYLVMNTDIRCLKVAVGNDNAPRETIIAYTNNKMFNAYPFDTVKIYNNDVLEKEVLLQNYNNTTNIGVVTSTSIDEYTSIISGDYIHEIQIGDIFFIDGNINSVVAIKSNKAHWALKTTHSNSTLTRPTYDL